MKNMKPAVLQWDRVIHKSARTSDGVPAGYIAAEDKDSVIVLSGRFREYQIPKSHVESFDGSQVCLDFPSCDLSIYKIV